MREHGPWRGVAPPSSSGSEVAWKEKPEPSGGLAETQGGPWTVRPQGLCQVCCTRQAWPDPWAWSAKATQEADGWASDQPRESPGCGHPRRGPDVPLAPGGRRVPAQPWRSVPGRAGSLAHL
jgi:hypothetical protein